MTFELASASVVIRVVIADVFSSIVNELGEVKTGASSLRSFRVIDIV